MTRRVLDAAAGCWFNMLHIHGVDVMFDLLAGYGVLQAVNWHDRETSPSLGEGLRKITGAVCGGLARWDDLLRGDPQRIRQRVADAIDQTGGRRIIVSSGCVSPVTMPLRNLRAVRSAVETRT
jgi:uroporphyrinogen decarboxylase